MNIKQTFRSISRDKLNTLVIVVSLAVGFSCTSLIALFISRELNTDSFQKNGDRIYMLKCDDPFNRGTQITACRLGGVEYMKENFAQVESYCRLNIFSAHKIVANGQTYFDRPEVYEVSPNFFNFFSYKLLTGNPNTVLETNDDIAISEELATKYFGKTPPLGQIITLLDRNKEINYIVKGVFSKPKDNSILHFDIIKRAQEAEKQAFILLKKGTNPVDLENIFEREKNKIPIITADKTPGVYHLENLRKVYFDTEAAFNFSSSRDKHDLWIAALIGILILFIASFNYLGLINNRLNNKTAEYSLRLVNGGSKFSLILCFMSENLLLIIVAYLISLELTLWILPFFKELVGSGIEFSNIFTSDNLLIAIALTLFIFLLTLLFSVIKIKKHVDLNILKTKTGKDGKIIQIPSFNIFQIATSIVLMICSVIIIKQMHYITNKDIGIDKDVIEVRLPSEYSAKTKIFREELLKEPSISLVSVTTASPMLEYWILATNYKDKGVEKQIMTSLFWGDENYINTLGIKLIQGRNFSGNKEADKKNCIINESFAKKFPDQNLLGSKLPGDINLIVIGIIKDFHYGSLKSVIEPGYIAFNDEGFHLLVKPVKNNSKAAGEAISTIWKKIIPDYPVNTETIRERFEWYHRENEQYSKLIGGCCLISLFLSMIGLFAVSYNSSIKRTKEIGIRKINGAKVTEIMMMLNKDTARWVIISFIFSIPFSWYVMHKWLNNYAFKTELSWWIFALAGIITLGIASLTVSWQSLRAATKNPVEALRYE